MDIHPCMWCNLKEPKHNISFLECPKFVRTMTIIMIRGGKCICGDNIEELVGIPVYTSDVIRQKYIDQVNKYTYFSSSRHLSDPTRNCCKKIQDIIRQQVQTYKQYRSRKDMRSSSRDVVYNPKNLVNIRCKSTHNFKEFFIVLTGFFSLQFTSLLIMVFPDQSHVSSNSEQYLIDIIGYIYLPIAHIVIDIIPKN